MREIHLSTCTAAGNEKRFAKELHCLAAFATRFRNDRGGAIAIIFALTIAMVVALVGGAVDYARWLSAKSRTVQAIDAAVLAGGRVLQLGKTDAEAVQAAQTYYDENKSSLLTTDHVTFSVGNNNEVSAVTDSAVKTTFLGVAGINQLRVRESAKAIIDSGSSAGSHVEVSLMLDTTGSMAGDKMVALKQAAMDLVNIVVWDDQGTYTSRVAVVPFSEQVNVGHDPFVAATGYNPPGNSDNRSCVQERQGADRYTDAAPGAGNYFDYYTGTEACQPQTVLLPLTSDKQAIEQRINEMQPQNSTAGHIGTAWAWYAVSPNFNSIWPSTGQANPYAMIEQRNRDGRPLLSKIVVLMTDGEYNTAYSGDDSATQARATCDEMKASGVTVYTVGFAIPVGGTADETMQLCATSSEHYYNAEDAAALKSAYRDIALKISTVRITE